MTSKTLMHALDPAVDPAAAALLARAQSGDGDAFRALTEPHRRELQAHCYRMLGSFQDAEDALQDTMLAAWQALEGFERRASIRTWLYRIATNRCLNTCRSASRRPVIEWNIAGLEPPEPTGRGDVPWLEPYPDTHLGAAGADQRGPDARFEGTESISLAFVTALQRLPPRQLAVLILRDVVGFHAVEVADVMGASIESINSALKRARASLQRTWTPAANEARSAMRSSTSDAALIANFVRAYESADLDSLVALLTDDVFVSMPPMPLEYRGRDAVAGFLAGVTFSGGRRFELAPTQANGQPAFGTYLRLPDGSRQGTGLIVVAIASDGISAITRFDKDVLPWFQLPRLLPDRSAAGQVQARDAQ